jgi:hypothetical protein
VNDSSGVWICRPQIEAGIARKKWTPELRGYAAFLLATYEPEQWDGAVVGVGIAAAWDELPRGDLVVARGDYHRWMQDARGWATNGLG